MKRVMVTCMIVLTLLVMAVAGMSWYARETSQNPVAHDAIMNSDVRALYAVVDGNPQIEGRTFIGDADAPITIAAYLDFTSPSSDIFLKDAYPVIRGHVLNGSIRYYPRYQLTSEDVEGSTESYWLAKSLACFPQTPAYEEFYLSLFTSTGKEEVLKSVSEYGVDGDAFQECLEGEDPLSLLYDLSEAKHFGTGALTPQSLIGIEGRDNSVILGIPSEAQLQQKIRKYEVRIGG